MFTYFSRTRGSCTVLPLLYTQEIPSAKVPSVVLSRHKPQKIESEAGYCQCWHGVILQEGAARSRRVRRSKPSLHCRSRLTTVISNLTVKPSRSRVPELRSCVKEEMDNLAGYRLYSPYGLCGRKTTLKKIPWQSVFMTLCQWQRLYCFRFRDPTCSPSWTVSREWSMSTYRTMKYSSLSSFSFALPNHP